MSSKTYYSDEAMPVVESNRILAFNQKTHGAISFNRFLTVPEIRFFQHAARNPLARALHPYNGEFKGHLAKDGYEQKDLLSLFSLIDQIRPHEITFKSRNRTNRIVAREAMRGLDVLTGLSVLQGDEEVAPLELTYGYLLFRLSDTEVQKVELKDDRFVTRTGWLVPVWGEQEAPVC